MLKFVPVIGPWVAGLLAEHAGERIVEHALAALLTALFFTAAILIVALVGWAADARMTASWIIDLVVIAYLGQSIVGVVSGLRALIELSDHWLLALFGVTALMAIQAVLFPLLGLFLCWSLLGAMRSYIAFEYGGGFFDWIAVHALVFFD